MGRQDNLPHPGLTLEDDLCKISKPPSFAKIIPFQQYQLAFRLPTIKSILIYRLRRKCIGAHKWNRRDYFGPDYSCSFLDLPAHFCWHIHCDNCSQPWNYQRSKVFFFRTSCSASEPTKQIAMGFLEALPGIPTVGIPKPPCSILVIIGGFGSVALSMCCPCEVALHQRACVRQRPASCSRP